MIGAVSPIIRSAAQMLACVVEMTGFPNACFSSSKTSMVLQSLQPSAIACTSALSISRARSLAVSALSRPTTRLSTSPREIWRLVPDVLYDVLDRIRRDLSQIQPGGMHHDVLGQHAVEQKIWKWAIDPKVDALGDVGSSGKRDRKLSEQEHRQLVDVFAPM